jgi:hypothetical protein
LNFNYFLDFGLKRWVVRLHYLVFMEVPVDIQQRRLDSVAELQLKGFQFGDQLLQLLELRVKIATAVAFVVERLAFENTRSFADKLEIVFVFTEPIVKFDIVVGLFFDRRVYFVIFDKGRDVFFELQHYHGGSAREDRDLNADRAFDDVWSVDAKVFFHPFPEVSRDLFADVRVERLELAREETGQQREHCGHVAQHLLHHADLGTKDEVYRFVKQLCDGLWDLLKRLLQFEQQLSVRIPVTSPTLFKTDNEWLVHFQLFRLEPIEYRDH